MTTPDDDQQAKALAAIEKLPPKAYMVFFASQVEGLTYVEIAQREGMSLEEVQDHMLEAIRIIVREMQ
ncbi:sigma factor-like helix-turn-helix DNA-binding protein [Sphingobium sp. B2]|uniref:sigma factor-like helix-turn-helix DNA-binding protein n=1 Tax=Sphingobium sp. B2 TaxID=2583228 RepID=UPI001643DD7E|nr:sigma factor-like helix-turn-helix DNA-binding protein [Sphingobium sp. B2]